MDETHVGVGRCPTGWGIAGRVAIKHVSVGAGGSDPGLTAASGFGPVFQVYRRRGESPQHGDGQGPAAACPPLRELSKVAAALLSFCKSFALDCRQASGRLTLYIPYAHRRRPSRGDTSHMQAVTTFRGNSRILLR